MLNPLSKPSQGKFQDHENKLHQRVYTDVRLHTHTHTLFYTVTPELLTNTTENFPLKSEDL